MNMIQIMMIIGGILVVGLLIVWFMMVKATTRKHTSDYANRQRKARAMRISRYLQYYEMLNSNVITRQFLKLVYNNLAELSVYSDIDVRIESVKLFFMANAVCVATVIISAFVFKDIILVLIFGGFAIVFRDVVITKRIDKMHGKLLLEESDALSELRQEYLRLREIPEALLSIQVGKLIQKSINEIHSVLTSENSSEKLEEFYKSSPLKTIQTLAGVCYTINNSGEPETTDGSSTFVTALSMISNEVNLEIRKIRLMKAQFGALEWLPLIPMLALQPIKWFFCNKIPGTASIYDGTTGYWFVVIILVVSLAAYKGIMSVTRPIAIKYDDRTDFDRKMMRKKWVLRIVTAVKPYKDAALAKAFKALKSAQSRLDINYLYWRKFYFATISFIAMLLVCIASVITGYSNAYNSIASAGIMSGNRWSAEEEEMLHAMDATYFSVPRAAEEDLEEFVKENTSGLSKTQIEEQVTRLQEKRETLENTKFQWWMVWLAFGVACIAWWVPNILIKLRTILIKSEAEEDCLQLQTIIGIMMNTSMDTLDLLDWLSKHSRVFRPLLIDAFQNYPSDPEAALHTLKAKAGLSDFKRLVDKLMLTIHQISIKEAFSDILLERDHLLRMREIAQQEAILSKRQKMSFVALSPMIATIGLYFIAPIALLGAKEMTNLVNNLSELGM